jgi:hypothetical protein
MKIDPFFLIALSFPATLLAQNTPSRTVIGGRET